MILSMAIFVPSCSTDSDSSDTQTENSEEDKEKDEEKDKDKEKDNPENPDTPENPDQPDNPGEKENPEEPEQPDDPEIPQEIPLRAIEVVRLPTKTSYDVTLDESFSREGLSVKCIYDDGSQKECTDYVLYHPNGNILHDGDIFTEEDAGSGAISIRVSYSEDGETFETSFWLYLTYTIPEPEPVEDLGYFWISKLPKTIYIVGDSLDLSGIKIDYYDQNNEWQEFTEEYTAEFYDIDTDISTPIPEQLSEGSFEVRITAKDGAITSGNTFSITVVTVKNISTFKHTNNGNSVTIGGFLDSGETKTKDFDYDAPYDAVESVSTDFEYKFIEGSTTDIVITGIKEERFPIITEVTIPASIDGYKVKQLAWDTFWPQWDDDLQYSRPSPIRTLIIEEGVENFVRIDCNSYKTDSIMQGLLPYLSKLVLPKGFSLKSGEQTYEPEKNSYHIISRGLKELTLPSDLTCIDFYIFGGRLEELVIPETVTEITMNYALSPWTSWRNVLKNVTFLGKTDIKASSIFAFAENLEEIKFTGFVYNAPFDSMSFPESIKIKKITLTTDYPEYLGFDYHPSFANLTTLEELVIDTTTDFTMTSFENCTNLKKLTINMNGGTKIKIDGFKNCTSLDTIEINSNTLEKIEVVSEAFANTKISSFDYDINMDIGEAAFLGTKLTSFTFHKDREYRVCENAFYGCALSELLFEDNCKVLNAGAYTNYGEISQQAKSCTFKTVDISKAYFVSLSFKEMQNLESVIVGNSICTSNFEDCVNLKTISISDNAIFLPFSLRNTAISEITLQARDKPKDIEDKIKNALGDELFKGCKNLKKAIFKNYDSLYYLSVPEYLFGKEPDGLEANVSISFEGSGSCSIGSCAFYNCKKLESSNIDFNNVSLIGSHAFEGCDSLEEIYVPKAILDDYSFYSCANLKKVKIYGLNDPNWIRTYTFAECKKLETVEMTAVNGPFDQHHVIGPKIFMNCENLVSVTTAQPLSKFGDYSFYNCKNLSTLTLTDSLEDLKVAATSFNGCTKVISTFINKNLMFEGASIVFSGTGYIEENLTLSIVLPNFSDVGVHNLTLPRKTYPYVPVGFAEDNTYLQTVTLDSDIEARAFKDCTSLTTVKLGDTTFHVARDDSFEGCTSLTKIIVPASYLEQYKSSPRWSKYKSLLCTE